MKDPITIFARDLSNALPNLTRNMNHKLASYTDKGLTARKMHINVRYKARNALKGKTYDMIKFNLRDEDTKRTVYSIAVTDMTQDSIYFAVHSVRKYAEKFLLVDPLE